MPNRIIREGILTSDKVDALDAPAEVFYRRVLSKVDDYGRFDARPSVLRASLFPLRIDRVREADCTRWMAACQKAGLIVLYSHDGKPYLEVVNTGWKARSESKFPPPPANENICAQVQTDARLDVDVVVDVVDGVVHPQADAPSLLDGVDKQVVRDFKAMRAKQKAPVTETALDGIHREAVKAGVTLESALRTCCERGWRGFKAEWVTGQSDAAAKASQPGGGRRAL